MEPVGVPDPADAAVADEQAHEQEQREAIEGEHIPRGDDAGDAGDGGQDEARDREQILKGVRDIWRIATVKVCPLWEITDGECQQLAEATVPVLEKYLPAIDRIPPEVTAAFTLFMVFGPRWGTPRHPPPPEEQDADAEQRADAEPEPEPAES